MKMPDNLTLTHTEIDYGGLPQTAVRLNMSVCEIIRALGCKPGVFFDEMDRIGKTIDAPILASAQDVADYKDFLRRTEDDEEYDDDDHALVNIFINMIYRDETVEAKDNSGKLGLVDSIGTPVVPPIFDECKGCSDIDFIYTLVPVRLGDKWWLTPRDNSGQLIGFNGEGFDSLSRSFCFAWVRQGTKHGILDARTGSVIIPVEMDWIETTMVSYVYGKDDNIGFAFNDLNGVMERYLPPFISAIDLTCNRFLVNGEWGWLYEDGRFTTDLPESFDGVQRAIWRIADFLEARKSSDADSYIEAEDFFEQLKQKGEEMMVEFKKSPAQRLKMAQPIFPEDLIAYPLFVEELTKGDGNVNFRYSFIPDDFHHVEISGGSAVISERCSESFPTWNLLDFPYTANCRHILRTDGPVRIYEFVIDLPLADAAKYLTAYCHHFNISEQDISVENRL